MPACFSVQGLDFFFKAHGSAPDVVMLSSNFWDISKACVRPQNATSLFLGPVKLETGMLKHTCGVGARMKLLGGFPEGTCCALQVR